MNNGDCDFCYSSDSFKEDILKMIDNKVRYYRSCNCQSCKDMCKLADELKKQIKEMKK